jgi:hypothetical protein
MTEILENLLAQVHAAPVAELPQLIGAFSAASAVATLRLQSPTVQPQPEDRLLDTEEAAHRLGVSRHYLYRHHGDFDFTRRTGKKLLFSSNGIARYISSKT